MSISVIPPALIWYALASGNGDVMIICLLLLLGPIAILQITLIFIIEGTLRYLAYDISTRMLTILMCFPLVTGNALWYESFRIFARSSASV